jgi:hypothetical protein
MRAMRTAFASTALAFIATPAFAHAHLLSAVPANAAIVSPAPKALTLTFSESVSLAFTGITLTGAAGAVSLGTPQLDADGVTLVEPLTATLPPGAYVVDWHALSTDGHKTHGSYGFTVK